MIDHPLLGIDDIANSKLLLYPNPAEGVVNLKFPEGVNIQKVEILNALGQLVLTSIAEPNHKMEQLRVDALPEGFYTVAAETNAGTLLRKLIIQ
jgi:hypothetical protein